MAALVDSNEEREDSNNRSELVPHHRIQQRPTPLPKLQLFLLLYLQLAEPITSCVILPFITQLIEETGITGGDVTKVGYYAGLVTSLFFATEALMILQWGRISDRIGRRPVLLTGVFGLGLSMLCFGLSHTFWAVVTSRVLAGALNGNAGVIKCTMAEITDETNIARAASFSPMVWALGITIGPLLGGSLQHPSERFGGVFGNSEFWERNPYFLPCLTAALYSASAFVLIFLFMHESAPNVKNRKIGPSQRRKPDNNMHRDVTGRPQTNERTPLMSVHEPAHGSLRTLLTRRVLTVILVYGLLAMSDIAFVVLSPVFLGTPISKGGLGMPPSLIGICLASVGVAKGVVSAILFPPVNKRFGTRNVMAFCAVAHAVCCSLFPVMNTLARVEGKLSLLVWVLFGIQATFASMLTMAFIGNFMFLSSAPPTRSALGATTGLAQTTTSIVRAIAPAGVTSLFALSIQRNLLGGGLVYVVMCLLGSSTAVSCVLLPARPWPRAND